MKKLMLVLVLLTSLMPVAPAEAAGCSNGWSCTSVDQIAPGVISGDMGSTSIATDPQGNPWVSFYDGSSGKLKVAKYVGTGGSGCAHSTSWSCSVVDDLSAASGASTPEIMINDLGQAWIVYRDSRLGYLKVAKYVGIGGAGCGLASGEWQCYYLDVVNTLSPSVATDPLGNPWITYNSAGLLTRSLRLARYVGFGGTGCVGSLTDWSCETIDSADQGSFAYQNDIAFDSQGTAWVSYDDGKIGALKVARMEASATGGCVSTAWTCTTVDVVSPKANGDPGPWWHGQQSKILITDSDEVWVTFTDANGSTLGVAHRVGSNGTGCTSNEWACSVVAVLPNYATPVQLSDQKIGVVFYWGQGDGVYLASQNPTSTCGADMGWECTAIETTPLPVPQTHLGMNTSSARSQDRLWVSYSDTKQVLHVANKAI